MEVAFETGAIEVVGEVTDIGGGADVEEVALGGDLGLEGVPTFARVGGEGGVEPAFVDAARESVGEHAGAGGFQPRFRMVHDLVPAAGRILVLPESFHVGEIGGKQRGAFGVVGREEGEKLGVGEHHPAVAPTPKLSGGSGGFQIPDMAVEAGLGIEEAGLCPLDLGDGGIEGSLVSQQLETSHQIGKGHEWIVRHEAFSGTVAGTIGETRVGGEKAIHPGEEGVVARVAGGGFLLKHQGSQAGVPEGGKLEVERNGGKRAIPDRRSLHPGGLLFFEIGKVTVDEREVGLAVTLVTRLVQRIGGAAHADGQKPGLIEPGVELALDADLRPGREGLAGLVGLAVGMVDQTPRGLLENAVGHEAELVLVCFRRADRQGTDEGEKEGGDGLGHCR